MRETIMICPELAAGSGGLADYTLRVAENWPSSAPLRFIVPEPRKGHPAFVADQVTVVPRRSDELLAALPQSDGAVLLQYSAYGFDHFGYPRWLFAGLSDWKRQTKGLLVIMFHEIWTFWPVLNKNYFVQQLHRRDIRKLVAQADAIFTSTASQAEHLRALSPLGHIQLLPVGTNVRRNGDASAARNPGVTVLFGLQQTRLRTLEKMLSDLRPLAQQKRITKVITVGAESGADDGERERVLLDSLQLSDGFEQRRQMGEDELSALLLSAQFGISDQDELSLTKSGTLMAYAAHELNVISPHADGSKAEPLCWLIAPRELASGVTPNELISRAARLRDWQERTASWPHIASQFARALRITE